MGHDTHFLSRLSRVSAEHTELAMSLYRDPKLVQEVFRHAQLPDRAERVAISLAHPEDGPFIVMSREGRFVTCLGPGMRASDLPLITRAKLDAAASELATLRERIEAAKRAVGAGNDEADLNTPLVRRLVEEPERLSREDVMGLQAWLPLNHAAMIRWVAGRLRALRLLAARLRDPATAPDAREKLRLALGRQVNSASVMVQLLCSDLHRYADHLEPELRANVLRLLIDSLELYTCQRTAARVLNGLSRGAKLLLPELKDYARQYAGLWEVQLMLRIVGQGHPKLRGELAKLLERLYDKPVENWHHLWNIVDEGEVERDGIAAKILGALAPAVTRQLDHVFRVALWLHTPDAGFRDHRADLLVHFGPLSTSPPEDLYLPLAQLEALGPVDPRTTADVFAAETSRDYAKKPVRAEAPAPGRNEPCSCGSGKKFKKCHGA